MQYLLPWIVLNKYEKYHWFLSTSNNFRYTLHSHRKWAKPYVYRQITITPLYQLNVAEIQLYFSAELETALEYIRTNKNTNKKSFKSQASVRGNLNASSIRHFLFFFSRAVNNGRRESTFSAPLN